jgi:Ni,Fe-hydrogenase III small subunit/Pyruvate/2-oxoacid:ferredoxin oxidoreductase delta subunit
LFKVLNCLLRTKVITRSIDELSASFKDFPSLDASLCPMDCNVCIERCPSHAIDKDKKINNLMCTNCRLCFDICKFGAIELIERPIIINENSDNIMMLRKKVKDSIHIRYVDTGECNACLFEVNATTNPFYDIDQYGISFVASPKHADVILFTGSMVRNMQKPFLDTIVAIPKPYLVIAVGNCACGNNMLVSEYAKNNLSDNDFIDVYIPGCPPNPLLIIKGILKALGRIK